MVHLCISFSVFLLIKANKFTEYDLFIFLEIRIPKLFATYRYAYRFLLLLLFSRIKMKTHNHGFIQSRFVKEAGDAPMWTQRWKRRSVLAVWNKGSLSIGDRQTGFVKKALEKKESAKVLKLDRS